MGGGDGLGCLRVCVWSGAYMVCEVVSPMPSILIDYFLSVALQNIDLCKRYRNLFNFLNNYLMFLIL